MHRTPRGAHRLRCIMIIMAASRLTPSCGGNLCEAVRAWNAKNKKRSTPLALHHDHHGGLALDGAQLGGRQRRLVVHLHRQAHAQLGAQRCIDGAVPARRRRPRSEGLNPGCASYRGCTLPNLERLAPGCTALQTSAASARGVEYKGLTHKALPVMWQHSA